MKQLGDLLANTKANWKDRLHGIRKLQCLIIGNGPSFQSFGNHIWDLRDALCAQLQDLRSAIVKEACSTVGALSESLGLQFEAMADYLIPSLLKLTFVTIHVIAESGNSCLKKIVVASCPLRSLPKFVDGCSSRHNALRLRCIECLFLLLEIAGQSSLEKYTSMLERSIRGRVSDALAETRKVARLCFWAYAKHFPEGARHLESSFSSNVKKHIEEEESTYQTMDVDELLSSSRVGWDGTSGASSFRRPASPFVASLDSSSKSSGVPPIQREVSAPSAMTSERDGGSARMLSNTVHSGPTTTVGTDRSGSGGHQHASSGSSRVVLDRVPSAPEMTVGTDTSLGDSVGHLGGAKRIHRRDAEEHDETDMHGGLGASGSESGTSSQEQYPSARDRRISDFVGITSKPGRIVATPKRGGSSSRDQESSEPHRGSARKTRPVSATTSTPSARRKLGMSSARKNPPTSARRLTVSHVGDQPRGGGPLLEEKDISGESSTRGSPSQKAIGNLEELITMSQSHSWSTRVECFRQLGSVQHAAIRSHFERVMQVFLDHLGDPHFRVVVEDLQCLSDFVRNHADMVEHHMLRLFPKIFLKLSDPKEGVRMAAGSALESLASVLAPSSVLPVLLHISAAHKNPKIRLACLEFTIHVIPQGQDYFTSPDNLHSALKRILPSTSDKNVDIRKASLAAMVALFKIDSGLFFEFLKGLTPERQKEVKKMMANSISSFGGSSSLPPTPSSKTAGSFASGGPFALPSPAALDGRPVSSSSSQRHKVVLDRLGSVDSAQERPRTVAGTPKRSSHRGVDVKEATGEHAARTHHQPDRRSRARSESAAASFGGKTVISPDIDVSVLLGQMSSAGEARKDALHQIISLSRTNAPTVWKGYFGQILLVVLETLKDKAAPHRELSLHCIREMLKNQTEYFDDFIEIVLARILEACHDESREVSQASDAAAEQFSLRIDPQKTLRVLSPFILTAEGTTLQVSIKMLSRLVGRVSYGTLMGYIPQVLPGLFDAFKSPNADIRKAVVFCLVDIYMVLGDDFTPYLSELNTSQLKLVTIYINRITKAREEREKAMRSGHDPR
jgi:CLIP-associating protein 1/2